MFRAPDAGPGKSPDHPETAAIGRNYLIRAMGAWLLLLPPYSPDLNPIEMAFAKLNALLRARAVRTIDASGAPSVKSAISSALKSAKTTSTPQVTDSLERPAL